MTMKYEIDDIIDRILDEDGRYGRGAYEFVLEALSFSQKKFKRPRHVSGRELLEGIKILLMRQFGPMTLTVLEHWGIRQTEDFGHIVFNLVNKRVLSKTEEDQIEHFKDAFDFEKVFDSGYRQGMEKKISRMR